MSFNGDLNASDDGLELETKGQIHTYSTENTALDVGTDGYILSADSTEGTGLKYIANTDAGLTLGSKGDIHTRSASNQAALAVGTNNYVLTAASGETTGLVWTDPASVKTTVALVIACGDETTAIAATGQKISFRMPYAMTLNAGIAGVTGSLVTAGTGVNLLTVDINEGGSTILSTKLTFDATETTTTSAATPVVISDTALAADSVITIDVDQLDSGGVAAGLKISLIGTLA